jgi:glycosidase
VWPSNPSIYEINTWVWLADLGKRFGKSIDLFSVPDQVWNSIAAMNLDAVWLMGIWERSPAGISVANSNEGLLSDFRRALPDFREEDNVGSPYCVRNYVVDGHFGGPEGLAVARRKLAERKIHLLLDFVPNHVAPDHPWVIENPDTLVRGTPDDLKNDPKSFLEVHGKVFACGRDPFFPAWPDVLQLNAFNPALRKTVVQTLEDISDQCDGVRCDMAMLLLNDVFKRTWGARAGNEPAADFWKAIIPAVKAHSPDFLFVAEAYWDLEWQLQQQGFDYCYDKRLYDRLEHESASSVRGHLCAEMAYQRKLVRFIENHDEPRAAATFDDAKERAAAVLIATIPGAKLFHEGQLEGRKVRLPVFLGRRPDEPAKQSLKAFYERIFEACAGPLFRKGTWKLCDTDGWPDNNSHVNLVAFSWELNNDRCLIVVNYSESPAQGKVRLNWNDMSRSRWDLIDEFDAKTFNRSGDEMQSTGLYVDLPPWGYHVLKCIRRK